MRKENLNSQQMKALETLLRNDNVIILKSRQTGGDTVLASYITRKLLHDNMDNHFAIISPSFKLSRSLVDRVMENIAEYSTYCQKYFQYEGYKVVESNRKRVVFSDNSSIDIIENWSVPNSYDLWSYNSELIFNEFAFLPDARNFLYDVAFRLDFKKIKIVSSAPVEKNTIFQMFWEDEKKYGFKKFEMTWWGGEENLKFIKDENGKNLLVSDRYLAAKEILPKEEFEAEIENKFIYPLTEKISKPNYL